jgi:two-component system sensor histidine kinase KdpD
VAILLAGDDQKLAPAAATSQAEIRRELADLAYRQGNSAAFPSELGGADIYLPIPVGVQRAGVLVARGFRSSEGLAEGCAVLLGLALERERFVRLARAAEQTRASDQMKSTLLAAIAHDLKTPVATARGAIENWAADTGGSEKAHLALDQLATLTRTIGELMEVVRLDAGIAHSHREVVSGAEIVEAAVARFGDSLARHTFFVDAASGDATVEVDPAQITEALGHGLENAARYSPLGAEIHVSANAEGDAVFLRVADRGGGVPSAERERVFERFVRLEPAEGTPGTGLGLSIARSLVEMNGGTLTLLEAPEGGTLFEIRLPRRAA